MKAYNETVGENPKTATAATKESKPQPQSQPQAQSPPKAQKELENAENGGIIKDEITYRTTRTGKVIATRSIQGEYDVKLSNKKYSHIVDPAFDKYEVFAGKGSDKELRVRDYLTKNYGGKPEAWFHAKGYTEVADENGTKRKANVHWFEEETVGIREMFVKGWSKK